MALAYYGTDLTEIDVDIAMIEKCIENIECYSEKVKIHMENYLVFLMKLKLIFLMLFFLKTVKSVRMLWNVA